MTAAADGQARPASVDDHKLLLRALATMKLAQRAARIRACRNQSADALATTRPIAK